MILNMVSEHFSRFCTLLWKFSFLVHCFLSFPCKSLNSCSWEISMATSENSQPSPKGSSSSSPIAYQPSSPYFFHSGDLHLGLAIAFNRELSNVVQWPRHSQPRTIWVLMDPLQNHQILILLFSKLGGVMTWWFSSWSL